VDIDLDGDRDILATGGHISQNPKKNYYFHLMRLSAGGARWLRDYRYWPPFEDYSLAGFHLSRVFVNDGGRFRARSEDAGIRWRFDGRGVMLADWDRDGRPDVLYVAQGSPPLMTRNVFVPTPLAPEPAHWVGLSIEGDGRNVNRDAVGTWVEVRLGGRVEYYEISATNGYAAQSSPWIQVAVGREPRPAEVLLRWPGGDVERWSGLEPDRYHVLRYGAGGKGTGFLGSAGDRSR
jgi:hypothetical protein